MNIEKAAEKLGLELRCLFPRVVGVSVHHSRAGGGEFRMYVDVNKEIKKKPNEIPAEYKGYRVYIRRIEVPLLGVGPR